MLKRKILQMQSFYERKWFALIKKSEWGDQRENEEEQEAMERDLGPQPSLGASYI